MRHVHIKKVVDMPLVLVVEEEKKRQGEKLKWYDDSVMELFITSLLTLTHYTGEPVRMISVTT